MMNALYVGLGGFLGAVMRWLLSSAVLRVSGGGLPFGTLVVNVLGCLAIGYTQGVVVGRGALSVELRSFLVVGLLGGFTTFSTFAHESLDLGRELGSATALAQVAAHVLLGLFAVWLGYQLARPG